MRQPSALHAHCCPPGKRTRVPRAAHTLSPQAERKNTDPLEITRDKRDEPFIRRPEDAQPKHAAPALNRQDALYLYSGEGAFGLNGFAVSEDVEFTGERRRRRMRTNSIYCLKAHGEAV